MVNGRVNPEYNTYISEKGRSIVDYAFMPHDCLDKCVCFKVMPMCDLIETFQLSNLITTNCKAPDHSILYSKIKIKSFCENIQENYTPPVQAMDNYIHKQKIYFCNEIPEEFMASPDFNVELNRIVVQQLLAVKNQSELDDLYNEFCVLLESEMDKHLRFVCTDEIKKDKPKFSKPYWNSELQKSWKSMCQAEKSFCKFRGQIYVKEALRNDFICKRKIFDKMLKVAERSYHREIVNNIEETCTNNPREFWKFIKKLGPRNSTKIPLAVYDSDGQLNTDINYVLNKWRTDFSDLLNRPSETTNDAFYVKCMEEKDNIEKNMQNCNSELNEDIGLGELKKIVKKLKNNKASGIDNIPNEVLKSEFIFTQIHFLMDKLFSLGIIPKNWKMSIISPIPKSSTKDTKIPLNYRGISLISCVGKLFSAIVNNRIYEYCERYNLLQDEQNGFRRKRSCEDHIFVLTSIIRNRQLQGSNTYCAFIDMQKAFDWVDRNLLYYILLKNGIQGKIFNCIKSFYENYGAYVKINNYYTEPFEIQTGVKQGDPLSPTLFCILIDVLIQEVANLNSGVNIDGVKISILAFADDIVLLAENEKNLDFMLKHVEQWCNKYRLMVNIDKTKIVHFRPKRSPRTNYNFQFNNSNLEIVDKYKYLGVILNEYINYTLLSETLAGAAGRALSGVISKFKQIKNIRFYTFEKLYFANVVPVLDYASGVWGYNSYTEGDKIQNRAIRYFLGVHNKAALLGLEGDIGWSNCKIRQNVNMIKLWNRLVLMNNDRLTKKIFEWDQRLGIGWSKEIFEIFQNCGFANIFHDKSVCDVQLINKKLNENRNRIWHDLLTSKPKLRTYRKFKNEIMIEKYVFIDNRKRRSLMTQIRLGILPLNIEMGRFRNQPVEERICQMCEYNLVEDEMHFILNCPAYEDNRTQLYNSINCNNFNEMEPEQKFIYMFKNESLKLCKYVEKSWEVRCSKLYNM